MRYVLLALLLAGCATKPVKPAPDRPLVLLDDEGTGGIPQSDQGPVPPWFTDVTLLFFRGLNGDWQVRPIKVRALSGKTPAVCFQIRNERQVDCFYVSPDGDVDLQHTVDFSEEMT